MIVRSSVQECSNAAYVYSYSALSEAYLWNTMSDQKHNSYWPIKISQEKKADCLLNYHLEGVHNASGLKTILSLFIDCMLHGACKHMAKEENEIWE